MADNTPPPDVDPAQLEAEGDPTITVTYAGESYTLPASLDDCDGDVVDALDNQRLSFVLRSLLSEDDWRRFKATKPKVRDYANLFDAYAVAIGLGSVGKS